MEINSFNSTLVQLKDCTPAGVVVSLFSFNSTLVQLKAGSQIFSQPRN